MGRIAGEVQADKVPKTFGVEPGDTGYLIVLQQDLPQQQAYAAVEALNSMIAAAQRSDGPAVVKAAQRLRLPAQ